MNVRFYGRQRVIRVTNNPNCAFVVLQTISFPQVLTFHSEKLVILIAMHMLIYFFYFYIAVMNCFWYISKKHCLCGCMYSSIFVYKIDRPKLLHSKIFPCEFIILRLTNKILRFFYQLKLFTLSLFSTVGSSNTGFRALWPDILWAD